MWWIKVVASLDGVKRGKSREGFPEEVTPDLTLTQVGISQVKE